MQQTSIRLAGKTIRLDIVEPARSSGPLPAIVLLHGAGGNARYWLDSLAPFLAQAGVALYAPHYFDRTGTERASPQLLSDGVHVPQWIDTIDHVLRHVATRPQTAPHRVAVIGVSLGSFLALALAAQLSASPDAGTRQRIRAIVDVSGGLVPPYAAQATPEFPPTLILHGDRDEIVPVSHARQLETLLAGLGVTHQTRIFPNEGHWFSPGVQMQLLLSAGTFLSQYLKP